MRRKCSIKNHVDDLMPDGNKRNGKMIRVRPRQLLHGKLHTDEDQVRTKWKTSPTTTWTRIYPLDQ